MMLALISFSVLSLLELFIWIRPIWHFHRLLAGMMLILLSLVTGYVLVSYFSFGIVLITVLNLYRMVNLLKLVQNRIQQDYLYHSTLKTSFYLITLQAIVFASMYIIQSINANSITLYSALVTGQFIVTLLLFVTTLRHIRKTTAPDVANENYADRDLPTLTVAIPARNETKDLEECLRSLVSSTYPKLEILVLDDCSQDKRTPEIIRSFAQDGVRFLAGKIPPSQWHAKNYAYSQLADEANGDLIMFCGVDCRFEPQSLTVLVKTLLHKRKSMISIMPRNILKGGWFSAELLLQPARYAWELALPRRIINRPPVLSTCWMIWREKLESAGGFDAVSKKGVPESYMARMMTQSEDGYSFLRSDPAIGLSSAKNVDEQRSTSIRTRYLQLHRRPELVALIATGEFIVLLWPLIILVASIASGAWVLVVLSCITFMLNCIIYGSMVNLAYRKRILRGYLMLPIAAIYDLGLLNYSMWQYEFGEVLWKGRNVSEPVMKVLPALPRID